MRSNLPPIDDGGCDFLFLNFLTFGTHLALPNHNALQEAERN
jgi:hypothetical protein